MRNFVLIALFFAGAAVIIPQHLSKTPGVEPEASATLSKVSTRGRSGRSGVAVGYRDGNGQYSFNAKINGTHVPVLVDTGASTVAINRTTALRIGIKLKDSDFRHVASTANGETKFASVELDEVRVNGVVVRNVRAAVLADSSLSETLLGMTFLNRLKKFDFDGNRLTLRQ